MNKSHPQSGASLDQVPQSFARAVFAAAAEVDAAETAIKHELLRAADAGDCGAITCIVNRWLLLPATEVLNPHGATLDSCGAMPVGVTSPQSGAAQKEQ